MSLLSLPELASLLDGGASVSVLDVRLAEDYAGGHVPEAVNHCVFEMGFGAAVVRAFPYKDVTLVVVGWGGVSQEAEVAAGKLRALGFKNVKILEGGMGAWVAAKLPYDTLTPVAEGPGWPVGRRELDLELCRVEWVGRNLLNKHWGTVLVRGGWLEFDAVGPLCGGEVVLDLRGILCTDLAGSPLHDVLIAHLESDDFFDVALFPKAVLRMTKAVRISETAGSSNLEITADLTLRGQTHSVSFLASGGLTAEGRPAAQAALSIDRTRWGVIYGSGKFFQRLAGHLVNDRIELSVKLVTL